MTHPRQESVTWAIGYLTLCLVAGSNRMTFRQLLAAGDKDVVYPILKWVVPQPELLEKRAFVGHYLSFPDVS